MGLRALRWPARLVRRAPSAPAALFVYTAALLAQGGVPPIGRLAWMTVAAAAVRTCAWAINRIVDADADRLQRIRAVEAGGAPARSGQGPALAAAVLSALVLLIAAGQLNRLALWFSPLPVVAFVVRPYAARWPRARHAAAGLTYALGSAGGWIAVRGAFEGPAWLLGGAVGLWTGGLDALHAQARQPTDAAAAAPAIRAHLGAAALWVATGWAAGRAWWYFGGLLAAFALVAWRYARAASNPTGPAPWPVLDSAGPVSAILLAATLADLLAYP